MVKFYRTINVLIQIAQLGNIGMGMNVKLFPALHLLISMKIVVFMEDLVNVHMAISGMVKHAFYILLDAHLALNGKVMNVYLMLVNQDFI